jgi:hypothetical protein
MTDAFLLQMDDFDRIMEFKLRRMLGAVVAEAPPLRRGRSASQPVTKAAGSDLGTHPTGRSVLALPSELEPKVLIAQQAPARPRPSSLRKPLPSSREAGPRARPLLIS